MCDSLVIPHKTWARDKNIDPDREKENYRAIERWSEHIVKCCCGGGSLWAAGIYGVESSGSSPLSAQVINPFDAPTIYLPFTKHSSDGVLYSLEIEIPDDGVYLVTAECQWEFYGDIGDFLPTDGYISMYVSNTGAALNHECIQRGSLGTLQTSEQVFLEAGDRLTMVVVNHSTTNAYYVAFGYPSLEASRLTQQG